VEPAKPSLELLRALTDEHVLRALMRKPRLTRAELAAATGVSKPTAGESVRRLVAGGLVADTGQRTAGGRGRGRVGAYYALADGVGLALAVSIAPEGIVAECLDPYGAVVSRADQAVTRPARPEAVAAGLRATATRALALAVEAADNAAAGGPVRLAVVSAADPVDRTTGRMVHLPDSPFLLGDLDPVAVLAPLVAGPVIVDNDVNWAARAERDHHSAGSGAPDDFAYLYLGEGLGCAVISDGEVHRGHAGLAGEIAHLLVAGPNGRATSLIDVFGQLGLRQPHATAIDTARLLAATTPGPHAVVPDSASQATPGSASQATPGSASQATPGSASQANATLQAVARAVAGAIAAIAALADPAEIVLGGPWGSHPVLTAAIAEAAAALPRPVPVRAAAAGTEPSLSGARADALARLRAAIISRAQPTRPS
jgi:predicted NBD/HSP70 family sugar kinase